MLSVSATVETDKDAARGVRQGVRRALRDAADAGFGTSQQLVPHGATSLLANSGFPPQEMDGGGWRWGYSAEHARFVEEGTTPHPPPIDPLKKWARRVLGDESAAWAVQQKIAEEGTDAQPFVQPGVEAQKAHLKAKGISARISDSL